MMTIGAQKFLLRTYRRTGMLLGSSLDFWRFDLRGKKKITDLAGGEAFGAIKQTCGELRSRVKTEATAPNWIRFPVNPS